MNKLQGLSPSSVQLWGQCPRKFYEEKMMGRSGGTGEAALLGTFVHLVLENLMQFEMEEFQQDGEWQEEPNFFDITCWKETAENVVESFRKGDRVLVSGRLEHSRWEDRKTGEKRSKVGVVADEVAATTRWATVEVSKVARSDGDRGRSGPDSRSDVDRGRSAPPRKRAPQREESYDNEEPF